MPVQRQPRFLKIGDVAEELAISELQVRALLKHGDLLAIQIGGRGQWRIERTKLEEFIMAAYTRTEAITSAAWESHESDI